MGLQIDIYPPKNDALSDLIAGYWHVYSNHHTLPLNYIPDGHQEIYFNLITGETLFNFSWNAPVVSKHKEKQIDILIVRFAPYGLSSLTAKNILTMDCDYYSDGITKEISVIVFSELTIEKKIEKIENAVQLMRRSLKPLNSFILRMVSIITGKKGTAKLKQAYENFYLTERQMENVFLRSTGLTPKKFARIIRLREAINDKKLNPKKSFTPISYTALLIKHTLSMNVSY